MKKFQEFFFKFWVASPFRVIRLGWKNGLSSFYIKRRKNRGIHDEWNFFLEMRTALVVVCGCTCVHFFRRFNHSPGFIIATTTFSIELISVCVRIPYGKSSAILLDFANQSHTRNCTSSSTLKIYAVQHSLCSLRLLRPLHLCLTGCL